MPILRFGPSRVTIDSWHDLVSAAGEGILDEHSYCELKKGLPPTGANKETARDLASFGVMGGLFIVGVRDAGAGKAGEVVGVDDAHAVKARLVAIADGAIQPSLVCEVMVIEDPDADGGGCVVVEIPPSAGAPHRVDDRYWGRGSEGKRVLADPEVADLFARRRNRVDDFHQRLNALETELDPVEGDASPNGRLFYFAEPAQDGPRVDDWEGRMILNLVSESGLPNGSHSWPDLKSLTYGTPHPRGIAAQSYTPGEAGGRDLVAADYAYGIQRMVVEDAGRTSYVAHLASFTDKEGTLRTPTPALYERVDHCVRVTDTVASTVGTSGQWRIGVRLTGLKGARRNESPNVLRLGTPVSYAEREYIQTVEVSRGDLAGRPEWVTEQLMSALARGFGEARHFPYESPASFWNE